MDLIITDNHTLKEVQDQFQRHFPNLKLEFFKSPAEESEEYLKKNMITDTHKTIGEVRHLHTSGHLSINGQQQVQTLEDHFREYYGINAQVFRKRGKVWLKTTTSDTFTLSELNREAEQFGEEEVDLAMGNKIEPDADVK